MTPSLPALSAARPFPQRVRAKSPIAGDAARQVQSTRRPPGARQPVPGWCIRLCRPWPSSPCWVCRRRGPPRSCSSTATSAPSSPTTALRCHGPDKNHRQADLRLDVREQALSAKAIVPGNPDGSELIARIFTGDPNSLMPPPDSNKKLTPEQKALIKRWVAEGAEYQGHWSYTPPVKPAVPAGVNAIDHLVGQRLAKAGLKPAPEADRRTLARRLYFDLTGLPPKPEEVDALANDAAPQAYENLVSKLLASPHYGERMALGWLDVVRFADTIGYHSDNPRNVWPYRDYVIKSFQDNKPFDKFTIEQLAGDLLPDSTQEQKVASCFNRLLLTTEEGGAQPKDYEARMLTDRVRAVGTVWLGQTLGCCQCHDHKYDLATTRDFYSLGAFFADIQEGIIGGREPGLILATADQQKELDRLRAAAAELQKQYDAPQPALAAAQEAWEKAVLAAPAAPGGGPEAGSGQAGSQPARAALRRRTSWRSSRSNRPNGTTARRPSWRPTSRAGRRCWPTFAPN